MEIDLEKEFALRNKLVKQFEESSDMNDQQLADFMKLMQLQDDLLEHLALELDSAAERFILQDEYVQSLDALLTKYESMLNEKLSLTRKVISEL